MHDGKGVFAGLPEEIEAGRYHSLAAVDVPDELARHGAHRGRRGHGGRHRRHPIEGVQFHPESDIDTDRPGDGQNFLRST